MDFRDLDYTRQYRRFHNDSREHRIATIKAFKNILRKYVADEHLGTVLEIGSGMGFCMLALKELGCSHVIGIDTDKKQVQYSQQFGLDVYHADATEFLKNCARKFDFVLAIDVLEHLDRTKQINVVEGIHQVLEPGGLFLCRVPNANAITASRYRYIDWTHFCSFTEESLDFVLFGGGFRDIRIEEANGLQPRPPFYRPQRLWRWSQRWLSRRLMQWMLAQELGDRAYKLPMSANIVGIARK